jgi:endonuclease-3
VQRIVKRLGIVDFDDPVRIEYTIMELLPQIDWTKWSHQMIAFGRDICKAKSPECTRCILRDVCNYYKKIAK